MKILFLLHSTVMGGATISAKNLIYGLKEKGIEVIVALPKRSREGYEIEEELVSNGIKCLRFTECDSVYPATVKGWVKFPAKIALRNIVSFFEILKVARQEKVDAIHTNTGVLHEGYYAAMVLKIPHFWYLREYQTLDFNMKIMPSLKGFKRMLKNTNTICITKDIQSYFGLSECRHSHVVYNPIYSVAELPEINFYKEKYFFIANRISREKGVDVIIKAFSKVAEKYPDYRLLIAGLCGDLEYLETLKILCTELGIENKVEFLGHLSSVKDYLRNAEALFVGSYNEGFGRMTAEANMIGCPVIGRNSAGTKEIYGITGGGILFNADKEIFDCVERLFEMKNNDFDNWKNWIADFQNRAIKSFSTEESVNSIFSMYKNIEGGGYRCIVDYKTETNALSFFWRMAA